ncbi:MAG TPA: mobile mystery protein B [Flammeovirgaceae bacterium]|nr:mobile mystery protein B [Flammeovirgaceae bacterium]
MGLENEYIDGQTPLDEDEIGELKIKTISTRGELDEFEQANIEKAIEWSLKRKYSYQDILTIEFVKEVHKRMFADVWKWAGNFRKTNKNIGVDKYIIGQELRLLLDDCIFWIENKTFPEDEIAIRFKHRMVRIHLFPNGNGRHSRLCADILVSHALSKPVFTWGGCNIADKGETRTRYLKAIYEADNGNIEPLLKFARS